MTRPILVFAILATACNSTTKEEEGKGNVPILTDTKTKGIATLECPTGTSLKTNSHSGGDVAMCWHPDGKRHGPYLLRYKGGGKKHEGAYRNGVPDGNWKGFAPDGTSYGNFSITDGTGTWTQWHDNGKPSVTIGYQAGKKHGLATYFDQSGDKLQESSWKEGWQHGASTGWSKAGTKLSESMYEEGRYHGFHRNYDQSGQLLKEDKYVHGTRVATREFENGKEVSSKSWPIADVEGAIEVRGHDKIELGWQKCSQDHECETVATTCCACSGGDYVAVHYKSVEPARDSIALACENARCPQQMCQPIDAKCSEGACAVVQ